MNGRPCRCVRTALPALLALPLLWLSADAATPAAYDGALSQVQIALTRQISALQRGAVVPAAQTPAAVAARVLTPITVVDRPGRPPAPVDSSLLLVTLQAVGSSKRRVIGLQAVADQIAALRRDVMADAGPEAADASGPETELRAVLASRTFSDDPLPPPSLLDRAAEWLDRTLKRLFHRRTGPSPTMPNVSLAFVKGVVIVLAAGAFAVLVAVLVQWLQRRPARTQPLALDESEAVLVEARDTDSLRALAEQKAQQGDYRLALRFVYLALLVALDTHGVVRFDRSKTNWEYLRALRAAGRADVYDVMTPLTREFDRVWYGFARAEAGDYARALAHFDALQAAARAPLPSRPPAVA